MEIKELQERVDAWIREYGVRYFSELTNMACLTEEVGGVGPRDGPPLRRPVVQEGRKGKPRRRDGRRAVGAGVPGQPDGRGPHGGRRGQFRQKRPPATRTVTTTTPSCKTPPAARLRPEPVKMPRTTAKAAARDIARLWYQWVIYTVSVRSASAARRVRPPAVRVRPETHNRRRTAAATRRCGSIRTTGRSAAAPPDTCRTRRRGAVSSNTMPSLTGQFITPPPGRSNSLTCFSDIAGSSSAFRIKARINAGSSSGETLFSRKACPP